MAEDKNNEQKKFDFTPEGESVEYISLGDARVMALRHAQENPEIYGVDYQNVRLVSELASEIEEEEYYDIRLSFRPVGNLDGSPGLEQFLISKSGAIELRQLLAFPTTEESGTAIRTTSAPAPPVVTPRAPISSKASSGGIPRRLLFGGLGAAVIAMIAVIAIVVAMAVGGSSGGDRVAAIYSNISDHTKAIQRDPGEATSYKNRGVAYRSLGQFTLADADKTTACSLDSKYC